MKYVRQLAGFEARKWGSDVINVDSTTQRILELAFPDYSTPFQLEEIQRAIEAAKEYGVEIIIHIIE